MKRQNLALAAALGCSTCLYLIGGELPVQIAATSEANDPIETPISEESPQPSEAEPQAIAEPQKIELDASDEPQKIVFEPPFPDRVNLFQAPKRQGSGGINSNGQKETAVELLGFVNVDGQRVVLTIDGLVSSIAEGGKEFDIEVISIQPPAVVLQRGRQRWQASLDN